MEKSPEEIGHAIELSSFRNLRSMEESEYKENANGFFDHVHKNVKDSSYRFMHKGESGSYHSIFTQDQVNAALSHFGPVMKKLGYDSLQV